jgi:hypothetical protein
MGVTAMSQLQHPIQTDVSRFEKSATTKSVGVLGEFLDFLMHNKKWWLTPIIFILLLLGVLVVLGGTAVGPFIYTLF